MADQIINTVIKADPTQALSGLKSVETGVKSLSAESEKTGTAMNTHSQYASMGMSELEKSIQGVTMRVMYLGMAATFIAAPFVALFAVIKTGIEAVDELKISTIQIAAQITTMQGPKNVAEHYKDATTYANALAIKLQEVDANSFANYQNLLAMTSTMATQGVLLDINNKKQVDSFTSISNAIAMMTVGQNQTIQFHEEIRALMTGEVRPGALLAQQVNEMAKASGLYAGGLKEIVAEGKKHGDTLERLAPFLIGINAASGDIATTWSAVTSSLQTAINMVRRAGFDSIFQEAVKGGGELVVYLKAHAELIGGAIKEGWIELKFWGERFWFILQAIVPVAKMAWDIFKELYGVVRSIAETPLGWIGLVGAAAFSAVGGITALAGGWTILTGSVVAMNVAMTANPFGLMVKGIALVAIGLQPVVSWLDNMLYKLSGISLTGKAFYEEMKQREVGAQKSEDNMKDKLKWMYGEGGIKLSKSQMAYAGIVATPKITPPKEAETPEDLSAYKTALQHAAEQYAKYEETLISLDLQRLATTRTLEQATLQVQEERGLVSHAAFLQQKAAMNERYYVADVATLQEKMKLAKEAVKTATDAFGGSNEGTVAQVTAYNKANTHEIEVQKQLEKAIADGKLTSQKDLLAIEKNINSEAAQALKDAEAAAIEDRNLRTAKIQDHLMMIDLAERLNQITGPEALAQRIPLEKEIADIQKELLSALPTNTTAWFKQNMIYMGEMKTVAADIQKAFDRTAAGGMSNAIIKYGDDATNVGKQIEATFTNAFKGMEDALVSFITTGTLNFKAMANSVISDIIRITIKQQVMGPLVAGIGAMLAPTAATAAASSLSTVIPAVLSPAAEFSMTTAVASGASTGVAAGFATALPIIGTALAVGLIANQYFTKGGMWDQSSKDQKWERGLTIGLGALGIGLLDWATGGGVFGTKWKNTAGGVSLGAENGQMTGQTYVDSEKKKPLFGGTAHNTDYGDLSLQWQQFIDTQFGSVKDAIRVKSAALGITISEQALQGFTSATEKINLSGLDAEGQQKAVSDYFRNISNHALTDAIPDLGSWKQVGDKLEFVGGSLVRLGEDATAAMDRMNAVKLKDNGLLMEEMKLLGTEGSAGFMELLNTQRASELVGLEDSTIAIKKRIWALEDEKTALKAVTDYNDYMEQKRVKTLATTANSLQDIANIIKTKLIDQISLQLSALQTLTGIKTGDLSNESPESKYKGLQAQYAAASDKDKIGLSTQLLTASQGYNASGSGYQSDYKMVTEDLARIGDLPNIADLTLTQIQTQTNYLETIKNNISDTAFDQKTSLSALLGNSAVLNTYMTQWFNAQTDATNAAKVIKDAADAAQVTKDTATETGLRDKAQAATVGMSNETAGQKVLRMAIGLDTPDMLWDLDKSGKIDVADSLLALKGGRPTFAVGSPYIPFDMTADIHQGEMVIDRASSDVLRKYGVPTTGTADNGAMLDELKALRAAVAKLEAQVEKQGQAGVRVAQAVGSRLVQSNENQEKSLSGTERQAKQAASK